MYNNVTGLFYEQTLPHVDALTFHIYPWTGLKEHDDIYTSADLDNEALYEDLYPEMYGKIFSEPFRLEEELETTISP